MKKYKVFISYSHDDKNFIAPVVQLIRGVKSDFVFQDIQDIIAGKPWKRQINEALEQAEIVLVFWCSHSAKSAYVKKEYKKAIRDGKDVLPILLDHSELDKTLAKYQWIDFRTFGNHQDNSIKSTEKYSHSSYDERGPAPMAPNMVEELSAEYVAKKMAIEILDTLEKKVFFKQINHVK